MDAPQRLFVISITLASLGTVVTSTFQVQFRDIATAAGLTAQNVYGGLDRKDFILETTGNGVAIFDYDGDGRNDIFIANGTRLDGTVTGPEALPQLYRNEGGGRFKNVAAQSGFTKTGWAQGD
jgi:enediyne biosynthesis protein E4